MGGCRHRAARTVLKLPSPSECCWVTKYRAHRLPVPGTASALAERATLPVFLASPMLTEATPRAILSWSSVLLRGVSRSPRPRPLDRRAPLLGFRSPTAHEEEGVHGPPHRRAPRFCRDFAGGSTRRLRCRSQAFPASQRLPSPSAVLPFPGRWRSWGSALQGFRPPTQPRRLVTAGMPS